jgi:transglutaminase-like putative cysteine protease
VNKPEPWETGAGKRGVDDFAWWRQPHGKSRLRVLAAAAMLLPAAFCFALAADLPHLFIIACCGMAVSMLVPRAIAYNQRTVVYSLLIAAVLAVIPDLVFPLDDNRFMFLTGVLAGNLTVPGLIYLAVLTTFFASGPYQLGICAAFSLLVAMFCGDYYGANMPNERFLLFSSWLGRFDRLYPLLILYEIAFLLLSLQLAYVPRRNRQASWAWLKHVLMTVALAAAVLFSYALLLGFQRWEAKFKELEMILMRSGIHRLMRRSNVVFRKEIDLYRTLNLPDGKDRRIVVRAFSPTPPGYLRARVYTHYQRGIWQSADNQFSRLPFRRGEGALAVTVFYRGAAEPPPEQPVIHFYTALDASEVMLAPGHANRYDLVADALGVSHNGMLQAEQWRKSGGYSVFVPTPRFEGAFPDPVPTDAGELLAVPKELLPDLAAWLGEALPGIDLDPARRPSDTALISALASHLQDRYRYSLNPAQPVGDPILHFLRTSRAGHCELFASAAVLSLRTAGIPARYVTGFVCAEPHPNGEYFVARMGDAHAWVEAWLHDQQRWILVEPTPASEIPGAASQWGWLESWRDRLRLLSQRILANLQRGYFAEAVITTTTGIFGFLRDLFWHPWRGTVAAVAGIAVALALIRRHRRRRTRLRLALETLRLHRAFAKLERRAGRAAGLPRKHATPIGEWAHAIAASLANGPAFRDLVDRYQALRFRQEPPSRDEAERLSRELRGFNPTPRK